MTTQREMQRVLRERRQMVVNCPQCRERVGLWLCIQPPGVYASSHGATDLTASLVAPEKRGEAMRQSAEFATKSTVTPWITCAFCGYDDHYIIPGPSEAVS